MVRHPRLKSPFTVEELISLNRISRRKKKCCDQENPPNTGEGRYQRRRLSVGCLFDGFFFAGFSKFMYRVLSLSLGNDFARAMILRRGPRCVGRGDDSSQNPTQKNIGSALCRWGKRCQSACGEECRRVRLRSKTSLYRSLCRCNSCSSPAVPDNEWN